MTPSTRMKALLHGLQILSLVLVFRRERGKERETEKERNYMIII